MSPPGDAKASVAIAKKSEVDHDEGAVNSVLVYEDHSGVVVCKHHGQAFLTIEAVRAHWIGKHNVAAKGSSGVETGTLQSPGSKPQLSAKQIGIILYSAYVKDCQGDATSMAEVDSRPTPSVMPKCLGGTCIHPLHRKYREAPGSLCIGERLEAIPGVSICMNGFQCPFCVKCSNERGMILKHIVRDHRGIAETAPVLVSGLQSIPLQRISCRSVNYFPILSKSNVFDQVTPAENVSGMEKPSNSLFQKLSGLLSGSYRESSEGRMEEASNIEEEATVREFGKESQAEMNSRSLFHKLSGLRDVLIEAGFKGIGEVPVELVHSASEARKNSTTIFKDHMALEDCLRSDLEEYLEMVRNVHASASPFVLKIVRPFEDLLDRKSGFFRLATSQGMKKYADNVSRFVLMIFRFYRQKASEPDRAKEKQEGVEDADLRKPWNLNNSVPVSCELLWYVREYLASFTQTSGGEGTVSVTMKRRRLNRNYACDEESSKRWTKRLVVLHLILRSILLVNDNSTTSAKSLLVRHFMALYSVFPHPDQSKRRFKPPERISPPLAALLYTASSVGLVELRRADVFPEDRIQEWFQDGTRPVQSKAFEVETVRESFNCSKNTAIGYIRDLLDKCMLALKHAPGLVNFYYCKNHALCGLIDGQEVGLDKLGKAVIRWQSEAEALLVSVLLNMPVPSTFDNYMRTAVDDFAQHRTSFSILEIPSLRNWSGEMSSRLLNHILGNANLRQKWFCEDEKGNTKLRDDNAKEWLDSTHKLQQNLLALFHVMGGGCARSTEIETLHFENTANCIRNVFLIQGELYFRTIYAKPDAIRGFQKPIVRVLDRSVSRTFLIYFFLVRRLECAIVGVLHGKKSFLAQRTWLFARFGKEFSDDLIRAVIRQKLNEAGIHLGFEQYRHYRSGMVRAFLDSSSIQFLTGPNAETGKIMDQFLIENAGIEDHSAEVVHAQSAHSMKTAIQHYAVSGSCVPHRSCSEMDSFRAASLAWGSLLMRAASGQVEEKKVITGPENVPTTGNKSLMSREFLPLGETGEKIPKGKDVRSKPAEKNLYKKLATDGDLQPSSLPTCQENLLSQQDSSFRRCISLREISSLTAGLREMYDDPNVLFRSRTQFEAVMAAMEGKEDFLVVIPTGGGKSIVFQLPAFLERAAKITVVLVPIVSLIEDLKRSCEERKLTVGTWETREDISVNLFLISIERVGSLEYAQFILRLANENKLARVVIEEAHVSEGSRTYRPVMSSLADNLVPSNIPVQRILLSATVPPKAEPYVMKLHGLYQYKVYRMSTVRSNLAYSVTHVKKRVSVTIQESMILQLEKQLKKEVVDEGRDESMPYPKEQNSSPMQIIVYCHSKDMVAQIRSRLVHLFSDSRYSRGVEVLSYHADLTEAEKEAMFSKWKSFSSRKRVSMESLQSQTGPQIVVATSAFGVGIDSSFVRVIVHVGFARGINDYVQESGRAGRDGKPARCIVLFNSEFAISHLLFVTRSNSRATKMLQKVKTAEKSPFASGVATEWCQGEAEVEQKLRKDFEDFLAWAENRSVCRRQSIYSEMDVVPPDACFVLNPNRKTWCDNCCFHMAIHAPRESESCVRTKAFRDASSPRSLPTRLISPTARNAAASSIIDNPNAALSSAATTTEANSSRARLNRAEKNKLLAAFRMKCMAIKGNCLQCAIDGEKHALSAGADECAVNGCFICLFPGHTSRSCPLGHNGMKSLAKDRQDGQYCYACGMTSFHRLKLHEARSEFGSRRTCPFYPPIVLGLHACLDRSARSILLGERQHEVQWPAISTSEMKVVESISVAYKWLTGYGDDEMTMNVMTVIGKFEV